MTAFLAFRRIVARPALACALASAVGAIAASQLGCGANPWQPPPPHGATYEYDWQGFRQSNTTVVAGGGPGYAYGGAFAFRERNGVKPDGEGKDPFAQSTPIDGLRFNDHLERQGARLLPTSAGPAAAAAPAPTTPNAAVTISASASASVTVPLPPPPAGGSK